jgi:hypothetical protein
MRPAIEDMTRIADVAVMNPSTRWPIEERQPTVQAQVRTTRAALQPRSELRVATN